MYTAYEKLLHELKNGHKKIPQGRFRGQLAWAFSVVDRQMKSGKLRPAEELLQKLKNFSNGTTSQLPLPFFALENGRIGVGIEVSENGIRLQSFFNLIAERELLSEKGTLWTAQLRGQNKETYSLSNLDGWKRCRADWNQDEDGNVTSAELVWEQPEEPALKGFSAKCSVTLEDAESNWTLQLKNQSETVGISRVNFPDIAAGQIGESAEDDVVIFPRGPGEYAEAPLKKKVNYRSNYPNGWCSMQFLAHYDAESGLYVGMHDKFASTKDIVVESNEDCVRLAFDFPAPDMHRPKNTFESPGNAVLSAFTGSWFDASQIYKKWVKAEAPWWKERISRQTPDWMDEIAMWALGGGSADYIQQVVAFAEYMDVPTAFHWYNWHQIPFDHSYPHYFPPKDHFAEGVLALQKAGVWVMPYINGRLWDTGTEDFREKAFPYATKNEDGETYTEEYGSGRKLAPMCPTTKFWQSTVQEIVLTLQEKYNVDGVYIDQIAAAGPRLCFDDKHAHPLAGGHWWVNGYWQMLTELRSKMGADKFLTTECNAEPYIHLLDGYLTWHWQYNNQIPIFSAVYGGKIHLFGRAYRGGATKDLALRMKAAQQLVFGEQLGWIDAPIVNEKENADYLKRLAKIRYAFRNVFSHGEMERPPQLNGDIPTVTADWQWAGEWNVTESAIQRGAWRAQDGRLVLFFLNTSDFEISTTLEFDGTRYGFDATDRVGLVRWNENGQGVPEILPAVFSKSLSFPMRTEQVYIVDGLKYND